MRVNYFLRAVTASGCVSFLERELSGVNRIYVIEGRSKTVKTRIMSAVGEYFDSAGEAAEYAFSPFGGKYLDAVIVRSKTLAVVDGELYGGVGERISSAASGDGVGCFDTEKTINEMYSLLYTEYAQAKLIHDEWEGVYVKNMDTKSLTRFCEDELNRLVVKRASDKRGIKHERFFGCFTSEGQKNYIENLTEGLKRRFLIKGRPGTGKSTFLKKLAERALSMGYETEVYYCGFDKESLDMVIVRDLSLAVFDSTAPHEVFPSGERDEVLDFYKAAHLEGTDERYEKILSEIKKRYGLKTAKGRAAFALALACEEEKEHMMINGAADAAADAAAKEIINKASAF